MPSSVRAAETFEETPGLTAATRDERTPTDGQMLAFGAETEGAGCRSIQLAASVQAEGQLSHIESERADTHPAEPSPCVCSPLPPNPQAILLR